MLWNIYFELRIKGVGLLYILFGIATTALAVCLDYLLITNLDLSFHTVSLLFIFPMGGFLLGILCGSGIFLYLSLRNVKAAGKHYLAAALIAFTGFWGVNYLTYASAYINNGELNYKFQGEHISNYMYNNTEAFSFSNYLDFNFKNAESTFRYKSIEMVGPVNYGEGINKISFFLDALGFVLGGLGAGLLILKDKIYCDKCKKYLKEKNLYNFTFSDSDREITDLQTALQGTEEELDDFISQERPKVKKKPEAYISVNLTYCPCCNDGFIHLKFMQAVKKPGHMMTWKENKYYNKRLKLDNGKVSLISDLV